MFNSKSVKKVLNHTTRRPLIVILVMIGMFVGILPHNSFAMQKLSDSLLAEQTGGTRYYIGPCTRLSYYNCVPADGVTCHNPTSDGGGDVNPDPYIDTPHSYRACYTNNPTNSNGCDRLETTYITVERQYYQANASGICQFTHGGPVVQCSHPGCRP